MIVPVGDFNSEMFALQSIAQQQGSHQQIFLPPRAPHQQLMQKVMNICVQWNWMS